MTFKQFSEISINILRLLPECKYGFDAASLDQDDDCQSQAKGEETLPSDISESDLLDMLTECMAIQLLKNNDTNILNAINKFDPEAALP